jgi:hypothetical protein
LRPFYAKLDLCKGLPGKDEGPVSKKNTEERMVKIGVARDQVEATIWRDLLLQHGIRAFIKNLDPLAPLPYVETSTLYNLEVYVQASDQGRARWILGLSPQEDKPAVS